MIKIEVKETFKLGTEEEVKAFIEKSKEEAFEKGYVLSSYTSTLKEKKSKGEVIDMGYCVTLVKKFNNFWEADL